MRTSAEYGFDEDPRSQEEPEGLDIREYLAVLFKFKWGILSLALLAGLLGVYKAYNAVPIYRSTAALQIERKGGPTLGAQTPYQFYQVEFYETQYELLHSWSVAEIAADKLGLFDADHLEGDADIPVEPGFRLDDLIPAFLKPREPEITPEVRRSNMIQQVKGGVIVDPVKMSELVSVSFESADPQWAADQANAVVEAYIDFLRDKNLSNITGNQSWYASRQDKARQDLKDAERALQAFLDKQGMVQTSDGVGVLQSQALQLALTRREEARQQKLALERLNQEIIAARSASSLQAITALESRGIVRQLKNARSEARRDVANLSKRYKAKHPRMIEAQAMVASTEQAYQDELRAVADAVVADYQRAVLTENSYTSQLEEAQADIQALNRNRAELVSLQEAVNTNRRLYDQLQSGEKTAGIMEGGTQNVNATVIEHARPGIYPVRPDKQRMVMLFVAGGFFLGVGIAFLLNMLDNTFKGASEVENRLGVPVLGQLTQLKLAKGEALSPMNYFVDKPRTMFSEAIRTIRTGVMLSLLDNQNSVIAVTSSVPGEGKTTLAINLAHSIAQMKKTLLIDADMRRPMVHRAKNLDLPHPGLSELVTGEATLDEVIEILEDGLHIISSGTVPANPLELLSSKRFKELVEQLKQDYEVVMIDSAPTLAVSDALVVSQMSDALVYVIRADGTAYQAVQQGIKRLKRANAPLLGCVLNQVTAGGSNYYGRFGKYGNYMRYGRYGYARYGYGAGDHFHDYYAEENRDKPA